MKLQQRNEVIYKWSSFRSHGDGRNHIEAISNFAKVLRHGGILVIDHRNFDSIIDTGKAPAKNIYYKVQILVDDTARLTKNKAGFTARQSRTVGQGQWCQNRSQFKNVTNQPTDGPTRQGVESRVRD